MKRSGMDVTSTALLAGNCVYRLKGLHQCKRSAAELTKWGAFCWQHASPRFAIRSLTQGLANAPDQARVLPSESSCSAFPYNPAHSIGTCAKCGKEMTFNVPRLGLEGGFVHKDTGEFLCAKTP